MKVLFVVTSNLIEFESSDVFYYENINRINILHAYKFEWRFCDKICKVIMTDKNIFKTNIEIFIIIELCANWLLFAGLLFIINILILIFIIIIIIITIIIIVIIIFIIIIIF